LYYSGARNFLILDVPRVQDSPAAFRWPSVHQLAEGVADWNTRLENAIANLKQIFPDTMISLFSTNALFAAILANPAQFKPTEDIKIVTPEYCLAYNE
jgi:phospholipase/lecithinase/hemolysin